MWFRGQSANRRLRRESVLQVRLHTRQVRVNRLRLVASAAAVSLFALAVLGVVWQGGGWLIDRLVYSNPSFAIRTLDIQTDGVVPVHLLQRWAGVKPGDNLYAVNLDRVSEDLELMPLVARATVDRVPPDALRIRVRERVPIAEVLLPVLRRNGEPPALVSYVVDATGQVLPPAPAGGISVQAFVPAGGLPRLQGVDANLLRRGRLGESRVVMAALGLLAAFEQSSMYGLVDVDTVNVSQPDAVEVVTSQGSRLVFGLESPGLQLEKWRAVHDYAAARGRVIQTLDLSVTNSIPATFQEAAAAPAEPARPSKVTRNKKRHV